MPNNRIGIHGYQIGFGPHRSHQIERELKEKYKGQTKAMIAELIASVGPMLDNYIEVSAARTSEDVATDDDVSNLQFSYSTEPNEEVRGLQSGGIEA